MTLMKTMNSIMQKSPTTLVLFLLLSFLSFGQNKLWSLQECVDLALQKNITIKQSELDYVNAQLDKKAAMAGFLPRLNANTSHSWNKDGD